MKFSLRKLVEEVWIEKGYTFYEFREDGVDEFEKYYDKIKKQFNNILTTAGIDKGRLRVGSEFEIDIKEKELVKMLIKNYDDRYVKGLRLSSSKTFSQEDKFKFLLEIEKMLEKNFKGKELIEQKEMFYGYTHILSDFKAYSIKSMLDDFLSIEFSKMQNYSYIDMHNSDERDLVDIHKKKIEALHSGNEAEYYRLCKLEVDEEFYGYYNITENDKIMLLDMYQTIIKDILNKVRLFAEKFSEVRQYEDDKISFSDKDSKDVFLQTIDDYKDTLMKDNEPIPERVISQVKEWLDTEKKKRKDKKENDKKKNDNKNR